MKEHGIMFSAPMVKALLAGTKTQTRRLATSPLARAQVGDVLWVRETWQEYTVTGTGMHGEQDADCYAYRADGEHPRVSKWRPAIHMPKDACRLRLRVTGVRVEPLHAISEGDAEAEGVVYETADPPFFYVPGIYPHSLTGVEIQEGAVASYRKLWEHLHGAETWAGNPDVLVLTFERIGDERP